MVGVVHCALNFDLAIVGPNRDGIIRFDRSGIFAGSCYLSGQGESHDPKNY